MLRKVRIIKSAPKARTGYQVQGSLANDVPAFGGADYNAYIGVPNPEVSKTIKAVPRSIANLEAEGGETVVGNLDGSKMPSFKTIKGPRHSNGGVPLLLPEDSFIFSDTKSMKIADPKMLSMFGLSAKKGGYTPAEISKRYDINNYRKILQDPNSDHISRKTAEMMIKNYVMKLGALAIVQESKKGFPQGIPLIARPYMEAMGLRDEDLVPELAQEEQQESAQYEQEETPQYEQEEMMSQEMPMGEYGMSLGAGMSQNYMGRKRRMYRYGGDLPIAEDGTPRPKDARKVSQDEYNKSTWKESSDDQGKFKYNTTTGEVANRARVQTAEERRRQGRGGGGGNYTKEDVCAWMKREGGNYYGWTAQQIVDAGLASPTHLEFLKGCEVKGEETITEAIFADQPTQDCPCKDKDGNVIPGKFAKKDENGNCLPCLEECTCKKSDGSTYTVGKDQNGNCEKCEEELPPEDGGMSLDQSDPEWWLQDTVNAAGAFGDLMSVRKQMPWEARVDLEEPRPTFLDPTRQLAANAEQANIASQATSQFAGPQAMGARLNAIQGQAAGQAANTLSQINNQNVGIANQFEGTQVGIRNQEQLMNQQMSNRLYDKNVIANQQFQNAKRQGRANMAQAYNTAVTNKWKADAENQLREDVKMHPGVGGRVLMQPTAKNPQATKPEMTMEEFYEANKGMPEGVLKEMMRIKYGKKYGGPTSFRDGGYIYTVFPIVTF